MKEINQAVLTGTHHLTGSQACAEGALSAGCRFLGFYPIFPSFDIVERFAERFSDVQGVLIQMEDEISALAAVLGASWTGKRAMTVTTGTGFAQMAEHIGLGVMLETPCVIVDVQRDGVSEGTPCLPGAGDMMQARWGSHGDYEIIALSPNSPQEMYDMTIRAFSLSEKYRTPVALMTDTAVSNAQGSVSIPKPEEIKVNTRKYYQGRKNKYLPFKYDSKDLIPPMVDIGDGYRFHVTGLTHDDRGYPVMDEACQELNVHRLIQKIRLFADEIVDFEEDHTDDADVVVVSYGCASNDAINAVRLARKEGLKAGSLRLKTVWPFPEKRITELAKKIKGFIVPEINYGQICLEVERCARGQAEMHFIYHAPAKVGKSDHITKLIQRTIKK
jgi:2-oxoglutarate ferredoxin oxidoreductase subunit alpha